PAGCSWSVTGAPDWVTFTSATSGSGNGTLSFNSAAIQTGQGRSATLTIAGLAFVINQAGLGCSFGLPPASLNAPAGGIASTVTLGGVAADCPRNASANVPWISLTSGASGAGPGTISFSVSANTSTSSRTGIISIGDKAFTVTQAGAVPCTYS